MRENSEVVTKFTRKNVDATGMRLGCNWDDQLLLQLLPQLAFDLSTFASVFFFFYNLSTFAPTSSLPFSFCCNFFFYLSTFASTFFGTFILCINFCIIFVDLSTFASTFFDLSTFASTFTSLFSDLSTVASFFYISTLASTFTSTFFFDPQLLLKLLIQLFLATLISTFWVPCLSRIFHKYTEYCLTHSHTHAHTQHINPHAPCTVIMVYLFTLTP